MAKSQKPDRRDNMIAKLEVMLVASSVGALCIWLGGWMGAFRGDSALSTVVWAAAFVVLVTGYAFLAFRILMRDATPVGRRGRHA
jgi:NADH:ubiquinone oxidoreductase subunit H